MKALTENTVKGLKPRDKAYYIRDPQNKGFAVRVLTSGAKVFYYLPVIDGKRRDIKIGPFPGVSLADARDIYREKIKARGNGLSLDVGAMETGTLEQLKSQYIANMKDKGKVSADKAEKTIERHVFSVINKKILAKDVTADQIKICLHEKIKVGSLVQSNRIRQYLHAMFEFGLKYDNDPLHISRALAFRLTHNPVSRIPHNQAAENVGERVLTAAELKNHYERFPGLFGYLHRLQVLLGGQRSIDVLTLQWDDIDFEKRVIDPSRASKKNDKANVLWITDSTYLVLKALKIMTGEDDYLFPAGTGGKGEHLSITGMGRAVLRFVRKHQITPYTSKDLRRTCKTHMGKAGIPKEVRDRLQNHALQDVSSRHYDRYDYLPEKKAALEKWEGYLKEEIEIDLF